eukprot:3757869-Amphidinium_carterae.2
MRQLATLEAPMMYLSMRFAIEQLLKALVLGNMATGHPRSLRSANPCSRPFIKGDELGVFMLRQHVTKLSCAYWGEVIRAKVLWQGSTATVWMTNRVSGR